jgi:hypothetical protein
VALNCRITRVIEKSSSANAAIRFSTAAISRVGWIWPRVPDLPFAVAVIPVKGLTGADQIEDWRRGRKRRLQCHRQTHSRAADYP